MKKNIVYVLIGIFVLTACGAKIESGKPDDKNKNQKISSPEKQALKLAADNNGPLNQIMQWDFVGGDFTRYFAFSPSQDGDLQLSLGSMVTYNCQTSGVVEVIKLETLNKGQVVSSTAFNTGNLKQKVKKDNQYQIKVTLLNLGFCEYLSYDFLTKFTESQTLALPSKQIIENNYLMFDTPAYSQDVSVDLNYLRPTSKQLFISVLSIGGVYCPTLKTNYEWVEFDSQGNEVSVIQTTRSADYPAKANTQHALRLTISGIQNCNIQTYSINFNSY